MNNLSNDKVFLLSPKGLLLQTGRTRQMVYEYDRLAVPALRRAFRLKERDRYIFGNSKVQISLSVADLGYVGLVTSSVYNFEERTRKTTVNLIPLSLGRTDLPASPNRGDVVLRSGEASLDFSKASGKRYIRGRIERFDDVRSLYVNVTLEEPEADGICSVLGSTAEPEAFRLTHKIMCMPASGTVVYGADTYTLSAEDSFACLDWERSVLTKDTDCSWYMGQGMLEDGSTVAFSFSAYPDSSKPADNAVFLNGTLYDPGEVKIQLNDTDTSIRLHSPGNKIDLTFTPILSDVASAELLRFSITESSHTYGEWNGTIKAGSGKPLEIRGIMGFFETTYYRW